MSLSKFLQQVIRMTMVMLFLIGCGTTTATPDPPTATPISPTLTPTPGPPTNTPKPTTSKIEGRVLRPDTGEPLANVSITLLLPDTALSDEDTIEATTEAPTQSGPKIGHWEGEPSVSFDVKSDGSIRNFKMVVTGQPTLLNCVYDLSSKRIVIEENGEFGFTDLVDQDELDKLLADKYIDLFDVVKMTVGKPEIIKTDSGDMIVLSRINGKFDETDAATGITKIWVCGKQAYSAWNEGIKWNAEWQGP